MKKILIIGSTGHLGSFLKNKIKKFKVKEVSLKRNNMFNLDLSKKKIASNFLKEIAPDIILNCAAFTNIDNCEKFNKKAFKTNFLLLKNLVDYCLKYKIKLIHISTDQFYNNKNYLKNEETVNKYKNYYTYTKLLAEKIAMKCNSIILRTNFFGENKRNLGFYEWIIKNSGKKIYGFSDIYFSPLYIDTLAEIIIKKVLISNKKGIYNLGSKKGLSKYNFIKFIIKNKNLKKDLLKVKYNSYVKNFKKNLADRPKYMIMNCRKFEKEFNIKLPTTLEELKKCLKLKTG